MRSTRAAIPCFCYGFATQGWMIYAIMLGSAPVGIVGPSLQSLMTKQVPVNEQGSVQGALSSLHGMMAVLGPLLATGLFGYFTSSRAPVYAPGAPFIASSILVLIAIPVALRSARTAREQAPAVATAEAE